MTSETYKLYILNSTYLKLKIFTFSECRALISPTIDSKGHEKDHPSQNRDNPERNNDWNHPPL